MAEVQGAYACQLASNSNPCEAAVNQEPAGRKKLTSVEDRVIGLEAVTLAFAVENNMSLSSVPKLITFAKVIIKGKRHGLYYYMSWHLESDFKVEHTVQIRSI